ncbi:MAG: ABC transporter ATP-binding protein [Myxococcota bacterium]
MMESAPLLDVQNLVTAFRTEEGAVRAVDDVSFQVAPGKTLAIVGESGCGKSVTALSIMRLIPEGNGTIEAGRIRLEGEDLLSLPAKAMRAVRGNRISMIFQEPMTALNPVVTIGKQIMEVFQIHQGLGRKQARDAAIEALRTVRIPDPEHRVDEYPFQMSGGMRQRVMIAMALACEPRLLIADEPTTALDVTIQAQILKLMKQLQKERGTSILFITHDLGVVAGMADEVLIMYAGKVVERGSTLQIFERPSHPYTQGLMASIPSLDSERKAPLSTIEGTVPGLHELPTGCRFHPRCSHAGAPCRETAPQLLEVETGHRAACHWTAGSLES